jgi:hypothetical protein
MDALTENNKVIGDYPKTVGIIQRENILQESGKLYNFDLDGSNVTYRFYDKFEYGLNMEQKFIQRVKAKNRSSFGYKLELKQQIDETPMTTEMQFVVPGSVSDEKIEYMEDFGFEYINNDEPDVRESVFNSFATKSIPLGQKDYSSIYRSAFESFNKSVVEMLMTDPNHPEGQRLTI